MIKQFVEYIPFQFHPKRLASLKKTLFLGFWSTIVLVTIFLTLSVYCLNDSQIVQTSSGPIRGHLKTTYRNKVKFYSYRGIPYAQSPVDDLRFRVSFIKILH